MEASQNKLLKAALWYRKKGFSVIPCKPRSKEALVSWTEYQKRLPTETEIHGWWAQNPRANVAIILGDVSGIITLEVDDEKAIDGRFIPLTPQAISGGKKLPHFYFRSPSVDFKNYKANSNGREQFSIRGKNQYVLAPPSVHPSGGPYSWFHGRGIHEVELAEPPDWILKLITLNSRKEDSQSGEISNKCPESVFQIKRERIIEVMCKNWIEGQRQEMALCLAGFLAKQGVPWPETNNLILEIATLCEDGGTQQRMGAIKATFAKVQNGQIVKGYRGLEQMLIAEDLQAISSLFDSPRVQVLEQLEKILWPEPLAESAFHGLAGQVVRAIEPHNEADPAALLVEFLTAFGSLVGPGPYFRVEADEHRMRLFVTLVGETSKAAVFNR
jgi:bifunctional DNA primase/polymerase-like protein